MPSDGSAPESTYGSVIMILERGRKVCWGLGETKAGRGSRHMLLDSPIPLRRAQAPALRRRVPSEKPALVVKGMGSSLT